MEWMAWTWQTAAFFGTIFSLIVIMTLLAIYKPETPRIGIFRFETTRGDRLFITLLGSGFILLSWLAFVGPSLWGGLVVCGIFAFIVFKWA